MRRPGRDAGTRAAARTGDDGMTTPLVLALAALLALLGGTVSAVAAVGVARQRAAAVADLAALAAAQHALEGQATACGWAARVAAADDAVLRSCRLVGDVAEVVSQVRPPGPLGRLGEASARARRPRDAVTGNTCRTSGVFLGAGRRSGTTVRHLTHA